MAPPEVTGIDVETAADRFGGAASDIQPEPSGTGTTQPASNLAGVEPWTRITYPHACETIGRLRADLNRGIVVGVTKNVLEQNIEGRLQVGPTHAHKEWSVNGCDSPGSSLVFGKDGPEIDTAAHGFGQITGRRCRSR